MRNRVMWAIIVLTGACEAEKDEQPEQLVDTHGVLNAHKEPDGNRYDLGGQLVLYRNARTSLDNGEYDAAEKSYDQFERDYPKSILLDQVTLDRAQLWQARENPEKALIVALSVDVKKLAVSQRVRARQILVELLIINQRCTEAEKALEGIDAEWVGTFRDDLKHCEP